MLMARSIRRVGSARSTVSPRRLSSSRAKKVRELLDLKPHARYVEVGAGTGLSAVRLATDFEVLVVAT